jgi:hypothetical protein
VKKHFPYLLLPLLAYVFPIVHLYARNADKLEIASLRLPLTASLLSGAVAYGVFFVAPLGKVQHSRLRASMAAAVSAVFFHGYGAALTYLRQWDRFSVEHYNLLPAALILAFYVGLLFGLLRRGFATAIWNVMMVAAVALVGYNTAITLPGEIARLADREAERVPPVHAAQPAAERSLEQPYPDIYYIVFDEYAGFEAIRGYWKDHSADAFEAFLEEKGFFIASESRSRTLSTITELVSRMDMRVYPEKTDAKITVKALRQNRAMKVLKQHGYTTVVMDMAFPDIRADINLQYAPEQVSGMAADEFRQTFFDSTMFSAFRGFFEEDDAAASRQRDMILTTLEQTANLDDVPGPKFVYTHILLPHQPFIFDEDGEMLDPAYREDWNYYLGQYKYATKLAQELIESILATADPDNPPVIIFQSDHGARNITRKTKEKLILTRFLENYSIKTYAFDIINALYLPGMDPALLKKDMDPMETFPLVLNFYLDAGVEIEPLPAR